MLTATPISRPVSSEHTNSCGVSRLFSIHPSNPFTLANRIRFFNSWLRRIAPDTHQDQASGPVTACRPGSLAAPEERWCRNVSNGLSQNRGCRNVGSNPSLAHVAGDPQYCKLVTVARHPIQNHRLKLQ